MCWSRRPIGPTPTRFPPLLDPAADHEDVELKRRREDVEEKHQRVRDFLDATGQDAVVLGLADSVAWFTSGGDLAQMLGSDQSSILLFINRTRGRSLPTTCRAAAFSRKSSPGWDSSSKSGRGTTTPHQVIAELCHNKRVATDLGQTGYSHVATGERRACSICVAG